MTPWTKNYLHQIIFGNCDHVLACRLESLRRRICIADDSGDKRSTWQTYSGNVGLKNIFPLFKNGRNGMNQRKTSKLIYLVLLAGEHYPRGQWPLTRVVEVIHGEDGYVPSGKVITSCIVVTHEKRQREREIKVTRTVHTRPITKLCRLEMSSP